MLSEHIFAPPGRQARNKHRINHTSVEDSSGNNSSAGSRIIAGLCYSLLH